MSERQMQIMLADIDKLRIRRGERLARVQSIPWGMFDAEVAPRTALQNHSQSLDRLSQRGGLDAGEAIAIMAGLSHRDIGVLGTPEGVEAAHRILYLMRALYRRALAQAEGAADAQR